MDNIRVKSETLSNWRSEFQDQVDEGVGALIKTGVAAYGLYKGGQWLKKKGDEALENAREKSKIGGEYRRKQIEKNTGVKLEQIEGGISVQNYADGVQFTEIETVDIIKAKPLREYKNIGPARVSPEAIDKPESEIGKGDNTILPERKPKGGKTKEIRIPLSTNEELTKMGKKDLLYRPETDNEGNIIPPKKSDLLYRPKTDKDGNIIPPKKVPMSDHYDWRNELGFDEGNRTKCHGVAIGGSGNRKDISKGPNEPCPVDYRYLVKNDKKKETVAASFEADLENLIIEIFEHDINELHKNGFTYQEVAEFYEIEQDLSEGWGNVLWQGGKFLATKVAPTVLKATGDYIKKRSVKDVRKVVQFARNPKNWARANKDIDKVGRFIGELPARTYAGIQAVNQKLIQPAKNVVGNIKAAKRGGDLAVIRQQIKGNIATNNPKILSAADKFTKSKNKIKAPKWDATVPAVRSTSSTTSTKRLTSSRPHLDHPTSKGLTYQQKQAKATNIIANIRRKTPKQIEADKILSRMKNAIDKSKKPGTYSANVDAAKKISDPGALVKTKGSSITKTPSTSITKTPPSSLTRKTPSGATKTPPSGTTRTTPSGSSYSPRNMINVTPNTAATVTKVAAGTAAAAVIGKNLGSKEGSAENETTKTDTKTTDTKTTDTKTTDTKTTETPKSITPKNDKENKTISNTEKKTVDPKKNEIVTKDSSSTDDGGKAAWLHKTRNSPAARSGAFTDDERWNTQLKHRAWKASRQRKKVNEAVMAIPIGIGLGKTALKLGGTVLAAKGGEEILKRLLQGKDRQDYDWEKNPKDDIDRELNTRQKQAKDSAKNRPHDRDIEAYRKTIDPKTGKTTLSPEDQIEVIRNAAAKHPANKKLNKKLNKNKK